MAHASINFGVCLCTCCCVPARGQSHVLLLFKAFVASVMKHVQPNVYFSQMDLWLSATAAPAKPLSATAACACAAICVRGDKAIFESRAVITSL